MPNKYLLNKFKYPLYISMLISNRHHTLNLAPIKLNPLFPLSLSLSLTSSKPAPLQVYFIYFIYIWDTYISYTHMYDMTKMTVIHQVTKALLLLKTREPLCSSHLTWSSQYLTPFLWKLFLWLLWHYSILDFLPLAAGTLVYFTDSCSTTQPVNASVPSSSKFSSHSLLFK